MRTLLERAVERAVLDRLPGGHHIPPAKVGAAAAGEAIKSLSRFREIEKKIHGACFVPEISDYLQAYCAEGNDESKYLL